MKLGWLLIFLIIAPAPTYAADTTSFKWHLDLRSQYLADENLDLGTKNDDPGQTLNFDARLKLDYKPTPDLQSYLDISAVTNFGDGTQAEDITGNDRPSSDYLELRQAWLRFDHLKPLQFQLGRQRIREDYALWWNSDLDAIRALYRGKDFKGFIGVAENLGSYRTSHDMAEEKRDILHIMGEASFELNPNDKIEFRALYEDDRSGLEDIGDRIDFSDYDREDGKIGWAGLRFAGTRPVLKGLKYRLDTILAHGDVEQIQTTGSLVTGSDKKNISGFAIDGGLDLPIADKGNILLGYAYGSKEFRQSEIYGNSSRIGRSSASIHNYGEVFRPELANLHVLTAGWSMPIRKHDLTLLYHYYRMDNASVRLQKAHINAATDGNSADIGHEIDAVMNIDLDHQIPVLTKLPGNKNMRLSTGIFKAGNTFAEAEGDMSYRALAEFRLRY